MNQTYAIAKRELSSLFYSPIAYVVLALFAFGSTWIFLGSFAPGAPAALRSTLEGVIWLMIFLVPAISMRLISEELRSGTLETLMTAPLSDTQVILGKWLGALGFFASLMLPLLVLTLTLEMFSRAGSGPDYGPVFTGLLGLMLVGGLYLAIGAFASAATHNQIIAFLLTIFIICILTFGMFFLPQATFIPSQLREALFYLNVNSQFADFNKGLIDTSNFVYFLSGIFFFLFLAVKVLESRRWR